MLTIQHSAQRPGEGWHRHGTTPKTLLVLEVADVGFRLRPVVLLKQRWLHVATGQTRHDRPVWDSPHQPYAFDVVVAALAAWLLAARGLHAVDWPWHSERPARRTVQRWARALAPVAAGWLQHAREHILDHVAPRHLEELLPAGGIPPPEGRSRHSQGSALNSELRDAVWLHQHAARALHIPLRQLLVVARWRWPDKKPKQDSP